MKKSVKDVIEADLYRYYGESRIPFKLLIFRPTQHRFLYALRQAQYNKNRIAKLWWRFRLRRLQIKTSMSIPRGTQIGKGLYIGHIGPIAINASAVIGRNCNITAGVVIGADNRGSRKGAPVIGNNVWIGTNAVIVGKITIGDDVLIAPNAFVNFDVPSHSLVIGNPGAICPKEHATEGFISNGVQ